MPAPIVVAMRPNVVVGDHPWLVSACDAVGTHYLTADPASRESERMVSAVMKATARRS